MAGVMKSEDDSVSLIRDGEDRIIVNTETMLNDDQMQDLFWAAMIMMKSGKTLREIFKGGEENGPDNRDDG